MRERLLLTSDELFQQSGDAFVDRNTGELTLRLSTERNKTGKVVFGVDENKEYYCLYIPGKRDLVQDVREATPSEVTVLLKKVELIENPNFDINILRFYKQKLNEAVDYLKV